MISFSQILTASREISLLFVCLIKCSLTNYYICVLPFKGYEMIIYVLHHGNYHANKTVFAPWPGGGLCTPTGLGTLYTIIIKLGTVPSAATHNSFFWLVFLLVELFSFFNQTNYVTAFNVAASDVLTVVL